MSSSVKTGFLELANKRYSVRHFSAMSVEREKIAICLEAARLAPSACNSQPWRFIVVDHPDLKTELSDSIFSGIYATNSFVKKAPVLVFVVSDRGNFIARVGAYLRDTRYYLTDIGIAAEHFVLQAAELGLGTCWIGWFNEKRAKSILRVPANKRIDTILAVGYPDPAHPAGIKRRKALEEISGYNKF